MYQYTFNDKLSPSYIYLVKDELSKVKEAHNIEEVITKKLTNVTITADIIVVNMNNYTNITTI